MNENFWHNDTDFNLIFFADGFGKEKLFFYCSFVSSSTLFLCLSSIFSFTPKKQTRKYIFRVKKLNLNFFCWQRMSEMKIDNR